DGKMDARAAGPDVGEEVELHPYFARWVDAALVPRGILVVRHGSKDDTVHFGNARHHGVGESSAVLAQGSEADVAALEREAEGHARTGKAEHVERGVGDFRADPVSGQDKDVHGGAIRKGSEFNRRVLLSRATRPREDDRAFYRTQASDRRRSAHP